MGLSDSWTDEQGYSFTFDFQKWSITPISKNIVNAKPGEANLTGKYQVVGRVQNTTEQRNYTGYSLEIVAQPMWSPDSAICSAKNPVSSRSIKAGFTSSSHGVDDYRWCTLQLSPISFSKVNPKMSGLPMGTQVPLQGGEEIKIAVPEDRADAIIAELQNPEMWVMGRHVGEQQTDCRIRGRYSLTKATADTGCTVRAQ